MDKKTLGVGIQSAIDKAGGQRALATLLDVSPQIVGRWRARGFVPWRRACEIEKHLGVPRKDLLHPELLKAVCQS